MSCLHIAEPTSHIALFTISLFIIRFVPVEFQSDRTILNNFKLVAPSLNPGVGVTTCILSFIIIFCFSALIHCFEEVRNGLPKTGTLFGLTTNDFKRDSKLGVSFRFTTFQIYRTTVYQFSRIFIFDRCHHSLAVVTPVKYECDSKLVADTSVYANQEIQEQHFSTPHTFSISNSYEINLGNVT